jgi:hypothetical protein
MTVLTDNREGYHLCRLLTTVSANGTAEEERKDGGMGVPRPGKLTQGYALPPVEAAETKRKVLPSRLERL